MFPVLKNLLTERTTNCTEAKRQFIGEGGQFSELQFGGRRFLEETRILSHWRKMGRGFYRKKMEVNAQVIYQEFVLEGKIILYIQ